MTAISAVKLIIMMAFMVAALHFPGSLRNIATACHSLKGVHGVLFQLHMHEAVTREGARLSG